MSGLAAELAGDFARDLVRRIDELDGLGGGRRRQVQELIREAAENAIDDAFEAVFPDFVGDAEATP